MNLSGTSRNWNRLGQLLGIWAIGVGLIVAALWAGGRASAQSTIVRSDDAAAAAVGTTQYLPYTPYRFPPIPTAPVLNRIDGAFDGEFNLNWTHTDTIADYYVVEQYFNESFAAPNVIYQGPDKSINLTRPTLGYYYYRAKAVNEHEGVTYASPYSNIRLAAAIGIGVDRNQINLSESEPCTTLRWRYNNVREVHINPGKGLAETGVVGNSQMTICPSYSTTYTARIVYPNSATQRWSVSVNVTGTGCNRDPYVNFFSASKNPVGRNEPFSISWNLQCAREVYFVRGTSETPTVGVGQLGNVTITADTTFVLKIKRADNTFVYASLLVRVR